MNKSGSMIAEYSKLKDQVKVLSEKLVIKECEVETLTSKLKYYMENYTKLQVENASLEMKLNLSASSMDTIVAPMNAPAPVEKVGVKYEQVIGVNGGMNVTVKKPDPENEEDRPRKKKRTTVKLSQIYEALRLSNNEIEDLESVANDRALEHQKTDEKNNPGKWTPSKEVEGQYEIKLKKTLAYNKNIFIMNMVYCNLADKCLVQATVCQDLNHSHYEKYVSLEEKLKLLVTNSTLKSYQEALDLINLFNEWVDRCKAKITRESNKKEPSKPKESKKQQKEIDTDALLTAFKATSEARNYIDWMRHASVVEWLARHHPESIAHYNKHPENFKTINDLVDDLNIIDILNKSGKMLLQSISILDDIERDPDIKDDTDEFKDDVEVLIDQIEMEKYKGRDGARRRDTLELIATFIRLKKRVQVLVDGEKDEQDEYVPPPKTPQLLPVTQDGDRFHYGSPSQDSLFKSVAIRPSPMSSQNPPIIPIQPDSQMETQLNTSDMNFMFSQTEDK